MRLALPAILPLALLAHPLLAQTAPVLGKSSFNGLKARVTAIRFFESGGAPLDPRNRVLTTRFDALTTRFINLELELEYAKAARRTPFQVQCRFEGPGGAARAVTLDGTVEPGWTGSYHAIAAGSSDRGGWIEGVYQVSCREAGQLIASTQVEVVKNAAAVGKLGAAVVQMKFFQSLGDRLPLESRRYSTRFDARSAHWIKTEFALVYPALSAETGFTVECAYVFPDRSVKRVSLERRIPAGWTGSVHVQGVAAESWPVGRYAVSCWNNGEKMAERQFEVFDGAAREASSGRVLFYSRPAAAKDSAAQTAFEARGADTVLLEASAPLRATGDSTAFSCLLGDPAGIVSEFRLPGTALDKDKALLALGPLLLPDAPRLRGGYRLDCRAGRAVLADGFEVTGKPDLPALDTRLVASALYAGAEDPPGDEAVPDRVFSAARLNSLWLVALLDRGAAAPAATLNYSCRLTGARNAVVAAGGPQTLALPAGERVTVLRQRLVPAARQHWLPGKYALSCASGTIPFVQESLELTK